VYTKSDKRSGGKRPTDGRYTGRSDQRDAEFINLELDADQRSEFKAFRVDVESINDALSEMVEDGYKITVRYDDRNECHAAFAFAPDGHDNAGYILTGRAGTGLYAVAELLFKHAVVMGRNWPAYAARSRRTYSDDD